ASMQRRICDTVVAAVVSVLGLLLGLVATGQDVPAKKKAPAGQAKKKLAPLDMSASADPLRPTFSAQVALPSNTQIEQKLHAIPEYVKVKAWKEVTRALQEILDGREDTFVPVPVEAGAAPRRVSARVE